MHARREIVENCGSTTGHVGSNSLIDERRVHRSHSLTGNGYPRRTIELRSPRVDPLHVTASTAKRSFPFARDVSAIFSLQVG